MGNFLCGLCALRGEFYCLRFSNETVVGNRSTWKTARHIEYLCVHSPYLRGCRALDLRNSKKTRIYELAMWACSVGPRFVPK